RAVRRLDRSHRPGRRRPRHTDREHHAADAGVAAGDGGRTRTRPGNHPRARARVEPVPRAAAVSERFQPPRGTRDWFGDDAAVRRNVIDLARSVFEPAGYGEVVTPGFEDTELFARSSGESSDVVSKEMYTFEDRGGRSVTLRPEGTAAVVRAYLRNAHGLPNPFKGYYVETLFRYGRPQKGRLREFRTFGVEVLG